MTKTNELNMDDQIRAFFDQKNLRRELADKQIRASFDAVEYALKERGVSLSKSIVETEREVHRLVRDIVLFCDTAGISYNELAVGGEREADVLLIESKGEGHV
jgi:hypothetical protein